MIFKREDVIVLPPKRTTNLSDLEKSLSIVRITSIKTLALCWTCLLLCVLDPLLLVCPGYHWHQGFLCGCDECICTNNVHCMKTVED